MTRKAYEHSAYWYAYHNGWTYSEAKTYTGKYLDMHTYHPRTSERLDEECRGKDWYAWRQAQKRFDSKFNPLLLCACAMVDTRRFRRTQEDEARTHAQPKKATAPLLLHA